MTQETGEDDYADKQTEVQIGSGKLTVSDPADPIPELEGGDSFYPDQEDLVNDQPVPPVIEVSSVPQSVPDSLITDRSEPDDKFLIEMFQAVGTAALITTLILASGHFIGKMSVDAETRGEPIPVQLEDAHDETLFEHHLHNLEKIVSSLGGPHTPTPTIEP
ncbi:MAG TPA: hypothetical protein ENI23_05810 [bacterium]|nr:hypothetical protein [bacterium]